MSSQQLTSKNSQQLTCKMSSAAKTNSRAAGNKGSVPATMSSLDLSTMPPEYKTLVAALLLSKYPSLSNRSSLPLNDFLQGGQVKVNPNLDSGRPTPVVFSTAEDGSVSVDMPDGCPPDMKAYNLNRALQRERKTKMAAKLRNKLAAKQGGK